jgi:hypothetical protein
MSERAERELGATFRPIAATIADEAAWYARHGTLPPYPGARARSELNHPRHVWWPPLGRSGGHQRAELTTATRQFLMSPDKQPTARELEVLRLLAAGPDASSA